MQSISVEHWGQLKNVRLLNMHGLQVFTVNYEDARPCGLLKVYRRFGRTHCLSLQSQAINKQYAQRTCLLASLQHCTILQSSHSC
jgi:hypothetical protein